MSYFISIIVPALNEEKYLPACLESLKNQDYTGQYEIVVVDNNSTDATGQVAQKYGATVVLCRQRGVAFARQAGAVIARGTIVVQADADTTYPPDWLSRIDLYFTNHPESVGLSGTFVYNIPEPFWAKIEYSFRYLANIVCLKFIGHPPFVSGANFAFRKDAFQKAGGYSAESLYPDQWGIAHRLSKFGKIGYCRTLYARTSIRRVKKPFHIILKEVAINTGNTLRYFFRYQYTNLTINRFPYLLKSGIKNYKPLLTVTGLSIFIIAACILAWHISSSPQTSDTTLYLEQIFEKMMEFFEDISS